MAQSLLEDDRLESDRLIINSHLEAMFEEVGQGDMAEVSSLAREVLMAGGKRLRPILILLAHDLAGGTDRDDVMPLALAFELIHTATLVHDDINDRAKKRRGVVTIHEKAGPAKALITGDWLFVQGFRMGGGYEEEIVELLSDCCSAIAAAELKQLDHVMDLATTPDDYMRIVRGKTAGPFASGCKAAALIAGADVTMAEGLYRFGMELGIAFQLVDDLLDLIGDERMGKPRGTDVLEGKMTLPLIHSLTLLHGDSREQLSEVLLKFNDQRWEELVGLLDEAGSIEYVRSLVITHMQRGLAELEAFAESTSKSTIEQMAALVMDRDL